ncbi:Gmad2 immunoglobulin-like domain-containing protein [Actinotalea sp. BY-33]|uniref:Gmad2 immunoglobulin-like domain-containing protein n=1 Tax=Actinotalea soli TaxID=2819234 RepID=A0A939RTZ4_9CELL|nr:Gmad2 immunoglobulin-like domain-containing protein [Actinotalea soli]MBO1750700.1 Gmad2 immunoglobulin-like domain-containing protein [Actinotalea soli]
MAPARPRALRALVTGGAVVLLLAACQTGSEEVAPSEPVPPTATEEPAQSPDPTPEPSGSAPEPSAEEGANTLTNGDNSILEPAPGAVLTGPDVTVSGEGTAFEANLNYHVLRTGTEEVVGEIGYTMAGANGEIGPWEIALTLDPGTYTVQVWEPNASDGEGEAGPFINLVEVTFTVE